MSHSLWPHELQHTRPPCPTPTPGVYPNSCPLSQWCHPAISSSVVSFSSCPQFFPASGSFQMTQHFESGGQSIGVSASTSTPMNTQDWFIRSGMLNSFRAVTTLCNIMDCSLPGSSVHGILQARILEWAAMLSSRGSFPPRDWNCVSRITGRLFTTELLEKPLWV